MRVPGVRLPPEWGIDPVPPEHRRLRAFDFFVLWFSLGVGLLVLAAGSLLTVFGLSLAEAALVAILGSVIGSAMLAGAGRLGADHGVPTMVGLRAILGRRGSYLASAVNVLQLVGWASFEVMVMGEAAGRIAGHPAASPVTYALVAGFGVLCALLAIGGPVAVVRAWLERFAVWLVIGSTVWISYVLMTRAPAWGGLDSDTSALLLGMDLVIAMPVSWWPLVCDYNRFAARPRAAFRGTFVGYALANTWFFVLGAALGSGDVIASVITMSLGGIALLLILVDETDNGFANVYSAAVSLQNLLPRVSQRRFVAAIAVTSIVAGVGLASVGGLRGAAAIAYEGFLLLIGGAFVPLLGVVAADLFLVRNRAYRREEFGPAAINSRWESLLAWAVGASAYLYLWWTNYGGGIGWPTLAVGLSLPSFGIALAVHYALRRWVVSPRSASRFPE